MSADDLNLEATQLAAAAVAGDEAALSKLLYTHHDRLLAEITSRLPDDLKASISAEDIAQETYIVAFQRIATFDPADHDRFYPWLSTIARNRLMDAIKARRADKRGGSHNEVAALAKDENGDLIQLLEIFAEHSQTPSRDAARQEAARAVERAMKNLPDDYGQALRMRYMEARPVTDIAARMNRTDGAIHMLCHRGLQALRLALGDTSQFLTKKS